MTPSHAEENGKSNGTGKGDWADTLVLGLVLNILNKLGHLTPCEFCCYSIRRSSISRSIVWCKVLGG